MPIPIVLLLLLLTAAKADVKHLSPNYLPPTAKQLDELAPAQDGLYFPSAGVQLPSGYAVPTGSNVGAPPQSPPNFPLPIYPPFFGFGTGAEALTGEQALPLPNEAHFTATPGQLSMAAPFVPQAAQLPAQFHFNPSIGHQYPVGIMGGQFPIGAQGGAFTVGAQLGPFAGQGPVGPPDYLTTQALPMAGPLQPFQQHATFGPPAGLNPFQQQQHHNHHHQSFSPSFGLSAHHLADELERQPKIQALATSTPQPHPKQGDTVYAPNGGYVYERGH
ncbi:collagen alpha-2(I) chain [Drosophila busckii]|uniref:collagen alpha-2(I) chain n=1 Tax=Drosophila busckii TaxID=30019 RepID=UPI001432DE13|nr:collagen alpha-2(I) chain [Drosophila busckii]